VTDPNLIPNTGPRLAEPWKRIVALLLDGLGLGLVVGLPVALMVDSSTMSLNSSSASANFGSSLLGALITSVVYFLYYALMIGNFGKTVAGMILGIQVIGTDGSPATIEQGFRRSAWTLLGIVPVAGGLAQIGLVIWGLVNLFNDPLRQTPWDKFGATMVVDG